MKALFKKFPSAVSLKHSVYWQQEKTVSPLCTSYTSLSIPISSPWKEKYSGTSIFSSSLFRTGTTCLHSPGEPSVCSCPGTPHGNVDTVPGLLANRLGRAGEPARGRGSAGALQRIEPLSDVH